MNQKNTHIDSLFQEQAAKTRQNPQSELWNKIERQLRPSLQKPYSITKRIFIYAFSTAATVSLCIGAWIILSRQPSPDTPYTYDLVIENHNQEVTTASLYEMYHIVDRKKWLKKYKANQELSI